LLINIECKTQPDKADSEKIARKKLMKTKTVVCSLVGLVTGVTLTGFMVINRTQAQTTAIANQPSFLVQTLTPEEHQRHHPQSSSSPAPMGMGMMNQQQVDQHFIQMMIPHHQGAIDMANLALTKATHPDLKKLAENVKTSQSKEIQEMKSWYKKWYGTDVPTASSTGIPMHSGTDMNQGMPMHSGLGMDMTQMMDMMGMMNMDLTALKNAPNFDQVFIEQMIPHHQMAVMMAAMVLDSPHPELRNLAKAIIQAQTAEIEEMFQWQQAWKQ
jgi:uncharacterized protein (DUF305 family)